jgi:polyhydroxyalkanoate synthesis regulator phasin
LLSDFYEYYKGIRRSGQNVTLNQAIDDFFGTDDPYAALYKGQVNRRVTDYATAEATGTLDEFKYLDDVADDAARSGDEVVDVVDDAAGKSGKAVDDVTGAADDAAGKSGRATDDVAGAVDDKVDDATDTTEPMEPKTAEPIDIVNIDPDNPNRLNQDLVSVGKTLDAEGEKFIDDLLDPSGNWFQKFGRKFNRKISTTLNAFLKRATKIQKQTVELLERAAKETDAGKKTKLLNQARENLTTLAKMDAEEYTSMVTWIDDYISKTGVDGRALTRALSQNQTWLQFEKAALEGTFWQKLWRGFQMGFSDYITTWKTLRNAWVKAFVNIADWGFVVPGVIRTLFKKGKLSFLAKFTPEEKQVFWRWFGSGYTTGKPIMTMINEAYRVGGVVAVVARMAGPIGLRALKASFYLTLARTMGGSLMTSQGWFDEPIIISNPFNDRQYDIAPLLRGWFPHEKIYEEDDVRSNFAGNFRKNWKTYYSFTIPSWFVISGVIDILESGSDETLDETIRQIEQEARDVAEEARGINVPVVLLPKLKNQLEDEGLIVDEVKPYIGRENNKYYCNCFGGRATIDKLKNIYPSYNEPDKDKFVVVWNADDKYFSLSESLVPSECRIVTGKQLQ